jgi:alpha-amylase/alpha-mannosidase (GH57 family)
MPHTYLVFVWHMHQPFYKDLATGEYQLPWTRMHALKDYYGMVQMLEDFPQVHQTFNLVPSMLVQIEEYASGQARDPFLRLALLPAEDLTPAGQDFILKYFFQAEPTHVIHRYPRYGQLYDAWRAPHSSRDTLLREFGIQGYRDLQVLSQLAWFDEIFLETDPQVRALVRKGRDFSLEDQALMGRKQREICGMVLPAYQRLAAKGQIELSVTPYYHPILPLLCDSSIASVAMPGSPLPRRFCYPQDARLQMQNSLDFARRNFGAAPAGMWPSEGSVSDAALALAADLGVRWMATDNGVLGATLQTLAGVRETYRPYLWRQEGREMRLIFRDHFLSDLIGFVYSRMHAADAAQHFLHRVRENAHALHAEGRDALVPVILDGENAWEHYHHSGRPFLKELYRLISEDPSISAVTVSEALERVPADEITRIHPGSWINANFDIWIGHEEDNLAWELLLEARETYDRVVQSDAAALLTQEQKDLALEELLIAEGSDWCWWYGPHHHSDNRAEFDKLFRDHLAHFYLALRLTPPAALSRPILRLTVPSWQQAPSGFIEPFIDGEITSYFEWLGAGVYSQDNRQGAMHGRTQFIQEIRYGSDGENWFLRVDLDQARSDGLTGAEIRVSVKTETEENEFRFPLTAESHQATAWSYGRIFEMSVRLDSIGAPPEKPLRFQISLWRDGLPLEAAPLQGWIDFVPFEPAEWD